MQARTNQVHACMHIQACTSCMCAYSTMHGHCLTGADVAVPGSAWQGLTCHPNSAATHPNPDPDPGPGPNPNPNPNPGPNPDSGADVPSKERCSGALCRASRGHPRRRDTASPRTHARAPTGRRPVSSPLLTSLAHQFRLRAPRWEGTPLLFPDAAKLTARARWSARR